MKKSAITVCLMLTAFLSFAKENEKRVHPDIKEVTVFLSGAQITSTANVSLSPGTTNVVFEDLSQYINDNNIQARGEGDFTILSVVRKMNYLNPNDVPKEVKNLQDSLENLHDRIDIQTSMWKIYDQEEQMLMANKSIGGTNTGVNVAELEKAANLIRTRLTEIQFKKLETKQKQKKLQEQIDKITLQLNDLNAKQKKVSSEITVSVSCKTAVNAKLFLSYVVSTAGWAPCYDIRAIDNASPIKLEYKANVWQNTGYDWDGVKLTLSTSNPYQSGNKPNLVTWWIYPSTPYVYQKNNYNKTSAYGSGGYSNAPAPTTTQTESETTVGDEPVNNQTTANYTTVTDNQVSTSFDIAIPYSIPTDNKPYAVDIQSYSVPASYRYYSAPKLDKDAFLLARITGWDQYNLLSGEANVFYEGMYVGKSYIDARNTSDTLDISLGRDKNVVVDRVKLKDLCEKKVIGLNKKETYTYEISIRNKKKQDIEIDIEDQVPVTQNKEVEVELLESSNAKYDATTGKLSWALKLKAGENSKMKFSFSVKFPKDKVITGL
ncbi:MAG TPA: DUF4139 domain-containing protein [Bacteroidia bacterium]|jgi:uncharacterized protein (TIGR02231 family)